MADTNDTPSLEQEINELVEKLGDESFDKTTVEPLKLFAATAEKRRRDTQSGYTKSQQELKRQQALANSLAAELETEVVSRLPAEAAAELEELKHQNPDEWHKKLKELEISQKAEVKARLETIAKEANGKSELEVRQEQFEAFAAANPEVQLTDEIIENDIPPRITRKLEKGEIDFATFLEQCKDYLQKGKVLAAPDKAPDLPNLGKVPGGSSTPSGEQRDSSYESEIY